MPADGKRTAVTEGLVITTASTVTAGSNIVFSKDADDTVAGIDLSAGTTGDSKIDNSKGDDFGMRLKGGSGKNTITGGAGTDYIYGGAKNDILSGNAANDTIDGGTAGKDSIVGGTGDDSILMNSGLTTADTISGGTGTDSLTFKDANSAVTDLDNVTLVEVVDLTNTTTDASITLKDATVAASASLTVDGSTPTTGKLTFDAALETDGTVVVIGGGAADTITGSSGADFITGAAGADSLKGGGGADSFTYTSTSSGSDTIVDFATATDKFRMLGDFLTGSMGGSAADAANAIGYTGGIDLDAAGTGNDTVQVIASGAATAAAGDLTTIADLNTAIGTITNAAANDERVLAFSAGDGAFALYYYNEGTAVTAALTTDELTLLASGTTSADLAVADFSFV